MHDAVTNERRWQFWRWVKEAKVASIGKWLGMILQGEVRTYFERLTLNDVVILILCYVLANGTGKCG